MTSPNKYFFFSTNIDIKSILKADSDEAIPQQHTLLKTDRPVLSYAAEAIALKKASIELEIVSNAIQNARILK